MSLIWKTMLKNYWIFHRMNWVSGIIGRFNSQSIWFYHFSPHFQAIIVWWNAHILCSERLEILHGHILWLRIFELFTIVFIYCGTVLENDNQTLDGYKVRANTMIQVFPKQHDMEYKSEPATSEQINAAVSSYRTTFKEMASSSTTVTPIVSTSILWHILSDNLERIEYALNDSKFTNCPWVCFCLLA